MSNSMDGTLIPPNAKSEMEDNKDRLSDLPDGVLLHILSFVSAKYAVRTCMLSTRWKDLWKHLPNLILPASDFHTYQSFTEFVFTILTLHDGSTALRALDFDGTCSIRPRLIRRIVSYAISRNVQRLGIYAVCDMKQVKQLLPCIFTCCTLTSLKLIVYPYAYNDDINLLPESLNLPALTTLHLGNFTFCSSGGNDSANPFSAFSRLISLTIDDCRLKDASILCISSTTLADLTLRPTGEIYTIELSTPNIYRVTCQELPCQYLNGSGVSSVKEVNFGTKLCLISAEGPLILLSWLRDLVNIRSLTISTNTLQVLLLVPDLLKIKLTSLANLKRLKIKGEPLPEELKLRMRRRARLEKAATETGKEAAELRKEAAMLWKTRREKNAPLPDGIVDFLIQNSPLAEVKIIDCLR